MDKIRELRLYATYQGPQPTQKVSSSEDANRVLRRSWRGIRLYETFTALYLTRENMVIGKRIIGQGGVSGVVADPKLIFAVGLSVLASSIIIAHNHPSGCLTPSEQDIRLSQKVQKFGEIIEMPLLDSLILSPYDNQYYSFSDDGRL